MKITQPELPLDLGPEHARRGKPRKSGKGRWYYVRHPQGDRICMLAYEFNCYEWGALTLCDNRIALFNNRCLARDVARRMGGQVKVYPYDPAKMRG